MKRKATGTVRLKEKCPIHDIHLVGFCAACRGAVRSKAKSAASRANGKLGGRPPGKKKGKE